MRREAFKFWDLVQLILETLRYIFCVGHHVMSLHHWCGDITFFLTENNQQMHHTANKYLTSCKDSFRELPKCSDTLPDLAVLMPCFPQHQYQYIWCIVLRPGFSRMNKDWAGMSIFSAASLPRQITDGKEYEMKRQARVWYWNHFLPHKIVSLWCCVTEYLWAKKLTSIECTCICLDKHHQTRNTFVTYNARLVVV